MSRYNGVHGPRGGRRSSRPRAKGLNSADLTRLLEGMESTSPPPRARGREPGAAMNKTEARYAGILEARRLAGEVVRWWFEPMNLKLAESTHYRCDFLVLMADGTLAIHEVKGGFVTEDAWVKTKLAARLFPFPVYVAQWRSKQWHITELPS